MADGKNAGASAKWHLDATAHGIYAEPLDAPPEQSNTAAKRGSIGFQFQTPDAMLGAVLKYKDLKEVVVMEMGVIELEFYHNLQHVTLKLTAADAEARDQLLKNIEEYSLQRPWIHKYDATVMGAVAHLKHAFSSK